MRLLRIIENEIGGQWTGVVFHSKFIPSENVVTKPMRLCEAIGRSFGRKLVLTRESIDCPGACRSLGWIKYSNNAMVNQLALKMDVSSNNAQNLIASTPYIRQNITAVSIGEYESPDVIVSYIKPEKVMGLVRYWQKIGGNNLSIDVSTVMSVCGNVVVKAYLKNNICISFGCPDSRESGGIEDEKLVVGVPISVIKNMM